MPKLSDYPKYLKDFQNLIPPLGRSRYKGQSGKVCVIGGSEEYTGAPYFSASSSLSFGLELSYLVCSKGASPIIKSYSPELIVYPWLDPDLGLKKIVEKFRGLVDRVDGFILGPGLGRDEFVGDCFKEFIQVLKELEKPMVLDADALYFLTQRPSIIKDVPNVILTPNLVEFKRLCQAMNLDFDNSVQPEKLVQQLSLALGEVCIVEKGPVDRIAFKNRVLECTITGGLKRCGGQGDVLSGILGSLLIWRKFYHQNQWPNDGKLDEQYTMELISWIGCGFTRTCSYQSFQKFKRATQTSHMLLEIEDVFYQHFDKEKWDV